MRITRLDDLLKKQKLMNFIRKNKQEKIEALLNFDKRNKNKRSK